MPPRIMGFANVSGGGGGPASSFVETTTSPATGAVAIFSLKEAWKGRGATVLSSSDGTTYNSSDDQITTGASGAGGMANEAAWFRIEDPDSVVEYVIQRQPGGDNTSWNVWKSNSAGFTGGSPNATTIPSAADGELVFSDSNLFNADGTYDVTIAVQDAAPWMWYIITDDGDVALMHIALTGESPVFASGQLGTTTLVRIDAQANAIQKVVTLMEALL